MAQRDELLHARHLAPCVVSRLRGALIGLSPMEGNLAEASILHSDRHHTLAGKPNGISVEQRRLTDIQERRR